MDINYNESGLVPVIAQDATTGRVLMLAYANGEALSLSQSTGYAHYFSRSRNKIWKKGELSGHFQKIEAIRVDCDADTLLYIVHQTGAPCHTGYETCFFRELGGKIVARQLVDPDEVYDKKDE
ncbi:MAG: phosphoribosyl-AMP cyclohydrolase [Methanomicrobiales archaeon]|jgi:phosphoribosyl-AMP cyclohydrolase|nr:phosphoribosyl-AMP cyclohydrolase [Methanomicrobiales archaeon]